MGLFSLHATGDSLKVKTTGCKGRGGVEPSTPRNVAPAKELHWFGEPRTRRASDGPGQLSLCSNSGRAKVLQRSLTSFCLFEAGNLRKTLVCRSAPKSSVESAILGLKESKALLLFLYD
jgi:hypothetical protein